MEQKRTNYLPWILLSLAVIACVILFFLLVGTVFIGLFSQNDSVYPLKGNVAIVEVAGIIKDSKDVIAALKYAEETKEVRAIVLRVNSPGGAVAPSQEIYDEVKRIAGEKVLVASFGAVAASGGYYVSLPARRIVADPGSITGSIGVILEQFIIKDLLKKLYLDWRIIKSGEVKDMGSPLRELTPKETKILEDISSNIHEQFKRAVLEERKIPKAELLKISDGRVFTGEQALKVKLVDELGGLEKACSIAAKMAGIKGKPKAFYPLAWKKKFWQYISEEFSDKLFDKVLANLYFSPMLLTTR